MQDAQDHCREEQVPLDLFLVPIETRSFIFPGIDIRIGSHLKSYFSNACSPYATIPEYDAYEKVDGTGTSWELDVNTRPRRSVICRIARLSIACRMDDSCDADEFSVC